MAGKESLDLTAICLDAFRRCSSQSSSSQTGPVFETIPFSHRKGLSALETAQQRVPILHAKGLSALETLLQTTPVLRRVIVSELPHC